MIATPGSRTRPNVLLFLSVSCLSLPLSGRADNWPAWRGPAGDGVSREKDLPIAWHEKSGLVWKTRLPEWGNSTPVVWDDAVFVTAHERDELLLLRISRKTGRVEWTRKVGTGTAARKSERGRQKFHRLHNLASPSPVTDGQVVVVHFGNGLLAAYDFGGNRVWERNLVEDLGPYTVWWGHANSPVIEDDLVISVCMQDSLADLQASEPAPSYLVAHELKTGRQRWYKPRRTGARAEQGDAYTTPLVRREAGQTELVVMGGNQLDAYDPTTGSQLWSLPGLLGGRTVTGPTWAAGLIFATRGQKGPLLAVHPGGRGERTRRDIVWSASGGTPDSCSPVVWDRLLFTITDDGIVRCFDVATGRLHWKQRLRGGYKASPVAGDGRIYFLNTEGLTTVVSASSRFDKLTENQVEDQTLASPAISGGRIYLRGRGWLYCVGL